MAQLRQDYQKFLERDTVVIVVGPENPASFREYWQNERLPFIGLPDPQKSIMNSFGQEVRLIKLGRMPAQVFIDKQGIIRFAHYGHAMSDIPRNAQIFAILDEMNRKEPGLVK